MVSLITFGEKWCAHTKGSILLPGQTDNVGNVSVLSRFMSSKFPLVVILTELAERLRQWDLDLGLDWIPRNQNEEADGLTNGVVSSFAPELEIEVDLKRLGLRTLDCMWEVADGLYRDVQERKTRKRAQGEALGGGATAVPSPGPKVRPLRERDPW